MTRKKDWEEPPKRPTKMTAGRKKDFLKWLEEGHAMGFICKQIGVTRWTLWRARKADPKFDEAVLSILDTRRESVEDALFVNALGGNVVAQIFWLKNRCPDRWRDVRHEKHEFEKPADVTTLVANLEDDDETGKPADDPGN